jgi:hypothetical protein
MTETAARRRGHGEDAIYFDAAKELQHVQRGQENEPGHYRAFQLPDASAMTEVAALTAIVAQARLPGAAWACSRLPATKAGHDLPTVMTR